VPRQTALPDRPTGTAPRMADVARAIGVSAITVSRALSRPERVSPATRARVEAAVRALGYVPNLAAGTLKSQRSRIVVAIVPTLAGSIFAETVDGMTEGLREAGYQLLLANSGYAPETEESLVRTFLGRRPDGLILTGLHHTEGARAQIRAARIPVVEIWERDAAPIDMNVGFSNFDAARCLTEALIARGYRRIAFAGVDPALEPRSRRREEGYRAALGRCGRAPILHRINEDRGVTIGSGARTVPALLEVSPAIDAVLFANDLPAFGAVQECARRGIAVPGRLAVAGFGDFEVAREAHPALTTVRVPGAEMGRRAARMILDRIAGRSPTPIVDLGFEVMLRASA
jgi:LacI family gluconate utilization system Gnt-I transcriptional repressor